MKKVVLSTIFLSILAFACTDNPLFKISLNIPYNGNYTISAEDQVDNTLILKSNAESYSTFISTVNEELSSNGIEGDFTADIVSLELTIPEDIELEWSVLGEVSIEFTVNGEASTSLDGVSFPQGSGKTLKVDLPKEGISINDFLSYENASLVVTADLSQELIEDVPLTFSVEVAVSTAD